VVMGYLRSGWDASGVYGIQAGAAAMLSSVWSCASEAM